MNPSIRPKLIPGCEGRQLWRQPEKYQQLRWDTPLEYTKMVVRDTAARVQQSRQHFPWGFFRGDCHSHTHHSDGLGTVAETADMVGAAGLDFQFVTDHWGVTQAPECEQHGLWVGQEPVTALHHLGILGLDYAFEPQQDFLADYNAAVATGATVFVPHPTGWWPQTVYTPEQTKILESLPGPFLMEICNGANNIVSAFDYTDESALALWDHLLNMGRRVHAMGNTDAHAPHGIGVVWNGVFAEECTQQTILAQLEQGHSFVSDAPLIHLGLGQARMGDCANQEDKGQPLELAVSDSGGLGHVTVLADAEEIFHQSLRNLTHWEHQIKLPPTLTKYVRAEVFSRDGRRAFSNPIYFSPKS